MKLPVRTLIALPCALALAACGGGNDDTETVAEDSVEAPADAAMAEVDAEPVVDETVVPAPAPVEDVAEEEPAGPSEDEVAKMEAAGERAAAAAADVAAIAAGAAAAGATTAEGAAQEGAARVEEAVDEGQAAAEEVTE